MHEDTIEYWKNYAEVCENEYAMLEVQLKFLEKEIQLLKELREKDSTQITLLTKLVSQLESSSLDDEELIKDLTN